MSKSFHIHRLGQAARAHVEGEKAAGVRLARSFSGGKRNRAVVT